MKTISALLSLLALGAQAIPTKAARPGDYSAPSYGSTLPSHEDKPKGFSDPILPNYEASTNSSSGNAAPIYEDKSKGSALPNYENKGPTTPGNEASADGAGSGSFPVPDYGNNPIVSDGALLPDNEKKPISYGAVLPVYGKKPASYGTENILPVSEPKPASYAKEAALPVYENKPTTYGTENSYAKQPNDYGPSVAGPVGGSGRVSGHGISIKHGKSKSKVKAHQGLLGSRVKAKTRSKFTKISL